ncbi:nucleotidyltransferase family protein [Longimicrobium sp.]|jgi:hypothetical protein|uniref:nucleotidyltransferase family protein n=1 Tax=Longimicrobium sp. TaxID=2029185 RepID=UPI002F95E0C2
MPRTSEPVLGALHLREWALQVLSSPGPPLPPPPVSPAGWGLFLGVERCALALAARGAAADDPAGSRAIRAQAVDESRSVLSARAELRRLGQAVRGPGVSLVVLKGAAPLLYGGRQVPMQDVDVLGTPAAARAVAEALDRSGFQGQGRAASHRLAVRTQEAGLPVEIHTTAPGLPPAALDRAVPVAHSPLRVLHPADHLLHLLVHSAVHHPDRRGRLRDLLLIADAVARCAPGDLHAVRAAAAREAQAAPVTAQLERAVAIANGAGVGADGFALTAAGSYLMTEAFPRWGLRGAVLEYAWLAGSAAVAARSGAPSASGAHTLGIASAFAPLAWLRRHAPRAERAARVLVRRGKEWALLLPVGLFIARAAERAVRETQGAG